MTGKTTKKQPGKGKIILAHLPYWDPLIPPMGIATLKSFLNHHGYHVKTLDLNREEQFKALYEKYFDVFKRFISRDRRGNLYNIGHDVLQNHMMAYINYKDEKQYRELVKQLIDNIFFFDASEQQVQEHHQVIDEFFTRLEAYFVQLFSDEKPAVLGLTVYKATLPAAMFVFKLAKRINPHITNLMGGGIFADTLAVGSPNLEFFLEKTKDYIDKIMIGKGEYFFIKALRNELPDSQRLFTMKDISIDTGGSSFNTFNNLPDLTDFDLTHYPYVGATGSTGCPFQCSFCNASFYYGEYKKKPEKQTVSEMVRMYDTYGTRMFFMTDGLLNPLIKNLSHELIQSDLSLYFDGYFRVGDDACDFEKTLLWRRGGFYRARLGMESGSQRVLDWMDKGITIRQSRAALAGLAYAGIKTTAYFVIGHPGETEQDFRQTLKFIEDVQNDIWQAECIPFAYYYNGQPGSDRWAKKRKLLYPPYAKDMLIVQTWIVDEAPSREETYNRVYRFVEHCETLGIPNPYSLNGIYKADERWKKLHKNAVPSLIDLMNTKHEVNNCEAKMVKKLYFAQNKRKYNSNFAF